MFARSKLARVCAVAIVLMPYRALASSATVSYGRITSVERVTERNRSGQTSGAILGGTLGAASGGNRTARAAGGALLGRRLGRRTSERQTFEYTVLIGTQSIRMVTDEAGMRVGDCVAVERGAFNNLRLVDDSRCMQPDAKPTQSEISEADSCIRAKEQLLDAQTDEDFDRAERRMRLLCSD